MGYWKRKALLQQARVLHRGVPAHVLARLYRVSPATLSRWLNYGLLPARRAARARLASMLQITDDELVASVRSTDHEGGVVPDGFQGEWERTR